MAQKYVKLNPIDHILLRPDMYVGSTKQKTVLENIATEELKIEEQSITFSTALSRLFVEVLSNAIDNISRNTKNKQQTYIKIFINRETGETCIKNDGATIPIEKNTENDCYNHTLVFGHLLSGSNYNDEEERIVSGKNGLGVKIVNVFSQKFKVSGVCDKVKFTQTWTNNMKKAGMPIVRDVSIDNYTEVKWVPDFKRFECDNYDDSIVSLFFKYAIDTAMLTNVNVFFNDELIKISSLVNYANCYNNSEEFIHLKNASHDIVVMPSFNGHKTVSFVNGIYTSNGGVHVDAWIEAFMRPILLKLNKKDGVQLNIKEIKNHFMFFINSVVINPVFDGQNKNKLESPAITASVPSKEITKICKWDVMDEIKRIMAGKEFAGLKKNERKKRGYTKIEGLDPANFAGTKHSLDCTLIVCEGLSAKTYAVCGIEKGVGGKKGRDYFGVMALRGKCLNVRNSNSKSIIENKVVSNLIKALGVKHETDYTIEGNYNTLQYGKLMLLCDADVDGIHISGLIINIFEYLFPSLLQREESFIVSMQTPIVRVFKKPNDLLFYDERRYLEYVKTNPLIKKKYYKGLGTTKPEDVPDTFGKKIVKFIAEDGFEKTIRKAFDKANTDDRKKWIEQYDPKTQLFSLDDCGQETEMEIGKFIDSELIKFSVDDCKRSIPNLMDGLKESQRKVLYAVFKKKLHYSGPSLKVAQLGAYTAEHTNYHHGEANLFETIIKLADNYVGSNNIPLLYRDGMFNTRLNGKDAASPRYIYTKLDKLTHLIYREEDFPLLTYKQDDGDVIEPEYYVPIIPMILINGASGIGTGWSTSICPHNIEDIVNYIYSWLAEVEYDGEIIPWYNGFTGKIEKIAKNKYTSEGLASYSKIKGKNICTVTELPIGTWIDDFKEMCEDYMETKKIGDFSNHSTPKVINFTVKEGDTKLSSKFLKLSSSIANTNMVLYDDKERLKKYNDVTEIIDEFCVVRYKLYNKRKQYTLKKLKERLLEISNVSRFIQSIISGELKVLGVEDNEMIGCLESNNYDKKNGKYDYLLQLQVRTFSSTKIKKIGGDILSLKKEIKVLNDTSIDDLWKKELEELMEAYKNK